MREDTEHNTYSFYKFYKEMISSILEIIFYWVTMV